MSRAPEPPAWKSWTPEPWSASSNGTLHASGFYIGEVDEPSKVDPSYASELDVANAMRIATCVNALSEVSGVARVPDALRLLEEIAPLLDALAVRPADAATAEMRERLGELRERLAAVRSGLAEPPPA